MDYTLFIMIVIIVRLVISILLAIIPSNIASKKGYNSVVFFLFASFFFIPALVVSECLRDKDLYEDNQRAELILKYKKLSEEGLITEGEFRRKTEELISALD